jgi:hypothetical protein
MRITFHEVGIVIGIGIAGTPVNAGGHLPRRLQDSIQTPLYFFVLRN